MDLVSPELAASIESSVHLVDALNAACLAELTPEALFQAAVSKAITAVEARGDILRRFLQIGPYEDEGAIPDDVAAARLSDADTEAAITILYSHAVNAFKGEIAEILALGPASRILSDLKRRGAVPKRTKLYVGDAASPLSKRGPAKGADLHFLTPDHPKPILEGVAEIKSFPSNPQRLAKQLASHTSRALRQLQCREAPGGPARTVEPTPRAAGVIHVTVCASRWKLSRDYSFQDADGRSFLTPAPIPPIPEDRLEELASGHWHVELGWSHEALAAEAYGLTYWYMEQLGVDLFSDGPSPWPEMSPEESGANAAKQSLYFAILRSTHRSAEQRAIALYNAYCFGYALGTSYKDRAGRRRMLWPQDLREMLSGGHEGRECWLH